MREDLEHKAHRGMAVLDPLKLVLTNWAEVFGSEAHTEDCTQPALPPNAIVEGQTPPPERVFKIGSQVWIEREDFEEVPPKGYKRLFPGNLVRLKGGYVIECTGCVRDASGQVSEVHAKVIADTKSGTPGADRVKAKAAIKDAGRVLGSDDPVWPLIAGELAESRGFTRERHRLVIYGRCRSCRAAANS